MNGSKDFRWTLLSVVLAVVGCGGGGGDDSSSASANPTSAAVAAALPASPPPSANAPVEPTQTQESQAVDENDPLVLEGAPGKAATIGAKYAFKPTVVDAQGRTLSFDIANKPAWATFSKSTGQLEGTPSHNDVGTSADIVIQVSDGENFATLPVFSITVPPQAFGSATLSWTPPTQNVDGSQLKSLGGYKIYWGAAADKLSNSITVKSPGVARYIVENLGPGQYFFAMTAFNAQGVESAKSAVASKKII